MRLSILGAGFIGLNFIRSSLRKGFSITVLDRNPCPNDLVDKLEWIQGDFSSEQLLTKALKNADIVLHFISSTVPGDQVDEAAELASNVGQTLSLLKLCVLEKVKRLIFISSASVYGVQDSQPIIELASTDPISSHGISKLTIEKYLQLYQYHFGLDAKILRLSNPYGPEQDILGRQGFVAIAIGKILSGDKLSIRGDGSIVRDYIYIDDVSNALTALCEIESTETIVNVGSGIGYTLTDVVEKIGYLVGKPIPIEFSDKRYIDIPASVLDISKAKKLFGFQPKYSLDEGLLLTLKHHKIATII